MPSGKVHTTATVTLASCLFLSGEPALVLGCLSGLIISPDIDCDDGFIGLYHLRRIWKPLAWFWRAYWYPYSRLVPHRSPISHSLLVGTLIRVIYLSLPFLALSFFVPLTIPAWAGEWLLWLAITDALHIIMDWLT